MARSIVAAAFGIVVGMTLGAACGLRAAEEEPLEAVAAEAGVDPVDLAGASSTTHLAPRQYLELVGELERFRPPTPAVLQHMPSARVECIIHHESRGNPNAVNPRSGASGLGQFIRSTWATTPQGRAGYSVFNAAANRAAVAWMLSVGRAREFEVVTRGLC